MGSDDQHGVRLELLRLETALASRDRSAAGVPLSDLIADDFVEFGASGQEWDVASVRRFLETEPPEPVAIESFAVDVLAADVALATYRIGSLSSPGRSNRVSVWVRRDGRWLLRFHQGTRTG